VTGLRADAEIVAKHLGVAVEFSDRLIWIERDGWMRLQLAQYEPSRVILYDQALVASYGARAADHLPKLLRAFDPSEPRRAW